MTAASRTFMDPASAPTATSDETPTSLTDEEVVARVLAGDVASFEHVMRRHNQRLYRLVRSVVKDDAEVEDVVQEAYVAAYLHLRDFERRASFSTWLSRIALHEAFRRVRRGKRQEPLEDSHLDDSMDAPTGTPETHAENGELRPLLEGAIFALPEHFRTVFVLRAVEELSVSETAETLDIPEETVKTRLHRARALLRRHLSERLGLSLPHVLELRRPRCDRIVTGVLARIRPHLPTPPSR